MSKKTADQYLHLSFDEIPLVESGSLAYVNVNTDYPINLVPGKFINAIVMPVEGYLSLPLGGVRYQNFKNNVTFGFWLRSVSLPKIKSNGIEKDALLPLFDISDSNPNNGVFQYNGGIIVVNERCLFDGFNQMIVSLIGSDGLIHSFESEIFQTGKFNHFMIAINMEIDEIKIFINGVEGILSSVDGLGLPNSLGTDGSFNLNINRSVVGSLDQLEKNVGIMDDFFIIDEYISQNYLIKKILSYGFMSSLNDVSSSLSEFNFNADISFLQNIDISPPVTAIDEFNSDVIAGTHDGYLLRGSSLFWNKKINLSSVNSLSDIKIVKTKSSNGAQGVSGDGEILPGLGIRLINNGIIISE
jgi:hypothetical protein